MFILDKLFFFLQLYQNCWWNLLKQVCFAVISSNLALSLSQGLSDPVLISLDVDSKLSEQLRQSFLFCRDNDKPGNILSYSNDINSLLLQLFLFIFYTLSYLLMNKLLIVFLATKHHVEYLRELLLAAGIETSYVYSSLDPTGSFSTYTMYYC